VSLYLDASAIVPTLIEEGASRALGDYLAEAGEAFVVSDFAAAEVASALSRLARMTLIGREAAETLLREFDAWRASATTGVEFVSADVRLANVFVRRFELGLRAPDALHLAVCQRGDHTLVTLDARLAAAARALGVRVDWVV
jgi:predicted nucleic acid-binding protein